MQYEGQVGDANLCKYDNGTLASGQPGCYNEPSNCTSSAAMGQGQNGAASFKFQGRRDNSVIYVRLSHFAHVQGLLFTSTLCCMTSLPYTRSLWTETQRMLMAFDLLEHSHAHLCSLRQGLTPIHSTKSACQLRDSHPTVTKAYLIAITHSFFR